MAALYVMPAHTTYATATPEACFAFDSSSGTITKYYNNEGNNSSNPVCSRDVEIPASIGGVSVTNIGNFYNDQLTSVTIPNSVTSIESYAFGSNRLTSVVIPDSVTDIGNGAFSYNQLTSVIVQGDPDSGSDALGGNPIDSLTYNGTAYSATNDPMSDKCYIFDDSSGAITGFHHADLQFIKSDGLPCLNHDVEIPSTIGGVAVTNIGNYAFNGVGFSSVVIPNSVTSIGSGTFMNNRLTSAVIPNSLIDLPNDTFNNNLLSSITIPDSVKSIGDDAFAFNRLASVRLPASVQSIYPTAFGGQNTRGRAAGDLIDPTYYLYGDDLTAVQNVYNHMWYAQLYTSDPLNPENLTDGTMSEDWYTGDVNRNGTRRDSLGGHLINPASVTLKYQDTQGHQLRSSVEYTGIRTSDGVYLTDYSVTAAGFLVPLDSTSPTSEESADLATGFAQYYRGGQTKSFSAPAIAGYTTPSSKTVTLDPGDNTITFVYAATDNSGSSTPSVSVNGDKAITKTPTIPALPTFTGVATPGAIVAVTVHSDPITCNATADTNGNWSCTLPSSLPAGNHTVYVQITNPDSSVDTLGPYSVVVKAGKSTTLDSATPLAPNTGVVHNKIPVGWLPITTIVIVGSVYAACRIVRQ